jgi:autotransporter-associated beta strand protein
MKFHRKRSLIITAATVACGVAAQGASAAGPLAFPGALGFGAQATGGRGGTVQVVTNLNDSGPGSFRAAVSTPNSIVVFDVGGVIDLQSELAVADNVTILGQTAPGQGIALEGGSNGYNLSLSGSSNDIVQYLRVMQGGPTSVQKTAIEMYNTSNAILDHISVEYAPYDSIDMTGNGTNISIQNSLLADPILGQQFNVHAQNTGPDSFFNNIFANSDNRNPMAKADTQFVNNVVYDFRAGYTVADTSGKFNQDILDNYFITGPSTTNPGDAFFQMDSNITSYSAGNLENSARNGVLNGIPVSPSGVTAASSPFYSESPSSALDAYAYDLATAGDSLHPSIVDAQVIGQVASLGSSGAIYNSPEDTGLSNGGFGTIQGGSLPLGGLSGDVPNAWIQQQGLTEADFSDPTGDYNRTGYDNIEKYAAALAGEPIQLGNSVYWNGSAGDQSWADAGNWSTSSSTNIPYGTTPGELDAVQFDTGAEVKLAADQVIGSLTANSTSAVVIGGGSHTLSTGAGGITNDGAGTLELNSPIILDGGGISAVNGSIAVSDGLSLNDGNYEFSAASGKSISITGTLNTHQATVDFSGSGATNINSPVESGNTGIIGGWATFNHAGWAALSNGQVVAYDGYLNYSANTAVSDLASYAGDSNLRVTAASTGAVGFVSGTTDINTLLDSDQTTGRTAALTSGDTLRLGIDGGIMQATDGLGLTLGATPGAGNITAGGPQNNNSGQLTLINDSTAAPMIVNANLADNGSGTVGVNISGTGVTLLAGDNTYTGGTNIDAGTVLLGSTDALPASGAVTMSQGATLDIGGQNVTIGSLNGSGTIDNNDPSFTGSYTITLGGDNSESTFNGDIRDSVGTLTIVKDGSGTLTLGGANTFSGGVILDGGALNLTNLSGAGVGTITLNNGELLDSGYITNNLDVPAGHIANVVFQDNNYATLGGGSVNTGTLTGGGTLNIDAYYVRNLIGGDWSSFTGTVNLIPTENGTNLGFNGIFNSTGTPGFYLNDGTLNLAGTAANSIEFSFYNGQTDHAPYGYNAVIGALTGTSNSSISGTPIGPDSNSDHALNYVIGGINTSTTFAGNLVGQSGHITNLYKIGTGSLTLTGNDSFGGLTEINGGTLVVNGTLTNATQILVDAPGTQVSTDDTHLTFSAGYGGTLAGVGLIKVPIVSNGIIAPGDPGADGTGTLTAASVTDNGELLIRISGDQNSRLSVANQLTLGADSTLSFSGIPDGGTYTIATFGSLTGTFSRISGLPAGYRLNYNVGSLSITPTPEPTSVGSLLAGICGFAAVAGRRRRASAPRAVRMMVR